MRFSPGRRAIGRLLAIAIATAPSASRVLSAQGGVQPLPTRLTDAEFWKLMKDGSEAGGFFQSDNFTSNEMGFPRVMAQLRAQGATGGAYLGVGPEQNFSYMVAIRPQIAFLVDIRRQSVIQHLMYKAIFELSKDRGDFVSLLFSKPRPPGIDSTTSIFDIWERYWSVPTDLGAFEGNLARIRDHLTRTHGFALDTADVQSLRYVYRAFYELGPRIQYAGYTAPERPAPLTTLPFVDGRVVGTSGQSLVLTSSTVISLDNGITQIRAVMSPFTTSVSAIVTQYYGGTNFYSLTMAPDDSGYPRGFLATEENYRFIKDLHTRNMFVPLTGDFAGPKAIRAVGQYLREHGTTLTAFYVSNVEQYLFQNNVWQSFYRNMAALPVTAQSVFIRGGTSLCSIPSFLAAFESGRVATYTDATSCVK